MNATNAAIDDVVVDTCRKMFENGVTPTELRGLYASMSSILLSVPSDRMFNIVGSLIAIGGGVYTRYHEAAGKEGGASS